jgi:hypothetical protein
MMAGKFLSRRFINSNISFPHPVKGMGCNLKGYRPEELDNRVIFKTFLTTSCAIKIPGSLPGILNKK